MQPEDIVVNAEFVKLDQPLHITQQRKHCSPAEHSAVTRSVRKNARSTQNIQFYEAG